MDVQLEYLGEYSPGVSQSKSDPKAVKGLATRAKRVIGAIGLLAGFVFLAPAIARADTTFDVSGNFTSPFAGTFPAR